METTRLILRDVPRPSREFSSLCLPLLYLRAHLQFTIQESVGSWNQEAAITAATLCDCLLMMLRKLGGGLGTGYKKASHVLEQACKGKAGKRSRQVASTSLSCL